MTENKDVQTAKHNSAHMEDSKLSSTPFPPLPFDIQAWCHPSMRSMISGAGFNTIPPHDNYVQQRECPTAYITIAPSETPGVLTMSFIDPTKLLTSPQAMWCEDVGFMSDATLWTYQTPLGQNRHQHNRVSLLLADSGHPNQTTAELYSWRDSTVGVRISIRPNGLSVGFGGSKLAKEGSQGIGGSLAAKEECDISFDSHRLRGSASFRKSDQASQFWMLRSRIIWVPKSSVPDLSDIRDPIAVKTALWEWSDC